MGRSVKTETTDFEVAKPRRLKWTCRFCERHFTTWTRRGLRLTCPFCKRVQEGPAGIQLLADEHSKTKALPASKAATTVTVVHANGKRKAPIAKPAAAAVTPKPPKPTPAAPPLPGERKGLLDRVLGF